MEIEPCILKVSISQLVVYVREGISDPQLISLPVDQVHPILLAISLLGLLNMFFGPLK